MKRIATAFTVMMCFLGAFYGYSQQSKKPFRVLSYNIMEGLKKDSLKRETFKRWAAAKEADVIALQEVNQYTAGDLRQLGAEMKYPFTALLKEKGYPTALLSKYPLKNIQRVTDSLLHGYLYAEVKGYHFFVLHLNPFDFDKRQIELQKIRSHAQLLPLKAKILMMGDFNSLSPSDSSEYNSRPAKLALLKAHELTRPHIRNVNKGNLDYSVIQQLLDEGYLDCWKTMNPRSFQKTAPTPVIKSDPNHSGRIDYIFCSKNLQSFILSTEIIDDKITKTLSDHYPLLIQLKN